MIAPEGLKLLAKAMTRPPARTPATPVQTLPPALQAVAGAYPALVPLLSRFAYKQHPAGQSKYGAKLEYWGRGESDSFDASRPALEAWGNVPTKDLAADIVSHYAARGNDPHLSQVYKQFAASITPKQEQLIRGDYRPGDGNYQDWLQRAGIPSLFRGLPFHQWGPNAQRFYTPAQIKGFQDMLAYLRTPRAGGAKP